MSENLFKAIYAKYAEGGDFYTATGGRMEYGRARDAWDDNFAVMQAVGVDSDYVFRQEVNDVSVQINCFSTVRATCFSILAKCKALYDLTTLTVTGCYPVLLRKENEVPPVWNEQDNLWQATIEFTCKLQPV